jgi:hypothetical protein
MESCPIMKMGYDIKHVNAFRLNMPARVEVEDLSLIHHTTEGSFLWGRVRCWMLNEVALLFLFSVVLVAPLADELAGIMGAALAISGFGSLCAWYFMFYRVWERNHNFICGIDEAIRAASSVPPPDRYRHSGKKRIEVRTTYQNEWTLFDFDGSNDRIPSPHFILLLLFTWFLVWSGALIIALLRLDELSHMAQLGIWAISMFITALVITLINPRLQAGL